MRVSVDKQYASYGVLAKANRPEVDIDPDVNFSKDVLGERH
jgi:hypothetical protein